MSHSYKKHPFSGITTAKSEKRDKRIANRRLRTKENAIMKEIAEGAEIEVLPEIKDVSDVLVFDKDGKKMYSPDSEYYKEAIRK